MYETAVEEYDEQAPENDFVFWSMGGGGLKVLTVCGGRCG
jgi:hypothetical protein